MSRKPARDRLLWYAFDLFGTHHSVTCPSCGQAVRDSYGERRENRLRRLIEVTHQQQMPDPIEGRVVEGSTMFRAAVAELAEHALGTGAGAFIANRMHDYAELLAGDHEAS